MIHSDGVPRPSRGNVFIALLGALLVAGLAAGLLLDSASAGRSGGDGGGGGYECSGYECQEEEDLTKCRFSTDETVPVQSVDEPLRIRLRTLTRRCRATVTTKINALEPDDEKVRAAAAARYGIKVVRKRLRRGKTTIRVRWTKRARKAVRQAYANGGGAFARIKVVSRRRGRRAVRDKESLLIRVTP